MATYDSNGGRSKFGEAVLKAASSEGVDCCVCGEDAGIEPVVYVLTLSGVDDE